MLPNKYKISQLNIPIIKYKNPSTEEEREDQVYCRDIIDVVTKDFFARKNNACTDEKEVNFVGNFAEVRKNDISGF